MNTLSNELLERLKRDEINRDDILKKLSIEQWKELADLHKEIICRLKLTELLRFGSLPALEAYLERMPVSDWNKLESENNLSPIYIAAVWNSMSGISTYIAKHGGYIGLEAIHKTKDGELVYPEDEIALAFGNLDLIKTMYVDGKIDFDCFYLVTRPEDPDEGYPVVHKAIANINKGVIEYVAEHVKNINQSDSLVHDSGMHIAAMNPNLDVFTFMASKGFNIDVKNALGQTPSHYAAANENAEIFKVLKSFGADIEAEDNDNNTPLNLAALERSAETIQALVDCGANLNHHGLGYATPLYQCVDGNFLVGVKILLQAGGIVDEPNVDGRTPLMCAAEKCSLEMVKYLMEHGASYYLREYMVPFYALKNPNIEILKHFISSGINVNWIACEHGAEIRRSLLDAAVIRGNKAAEYLLRSHGALTFQEMKNALWGAPFFQIPIVEGHNTADYFWIAPIREGANELDWLSEGQISIQEEYVTYLLRPLIKKYQIGQYDSYGSNIILCVNLWEMCGEMQRIADLFRTDYNNPELDQYKEGFGVVFDFSKNITTLDAYFSLTDDEKKELMFIRKEVIISFYERVKNRLELMLRKYEPQGFKRIQFMGP